MTIKEKFYEGRCKVCRSKHRSHYEEMRTKGSTLMDIEAEAKKLEGDMHPSYGSFQRHFERHYIPYIQEKIKRDKFTDTLVKEKMKQGVHILDEMLENLTICRRVVGNLTSIIDRNLEQMVSSGDTSFLNSLKGLLSETRLTLEATQKLRSSLIVEPQESAEESISTIIDILQKVLPEKYLLEVVGEMKEHIQ